ncbi:MAG: N-glycosyltransferase [Candidatus Methanofastidiosum methylothiophilum]|uniref:N-glycosyltransferase n=1 Tax=Candidatus Methanofastidiosum methylothiophilum TaxID=1705564 RepID=A0A150IML6_9EURY|nr:MAG: N-glycosyltransferase [Candidatus Methanofastidiosum methylthiophilus]
MGIIAVVIIYSFLVGIINLIFPKIFRPTKIANQLPSVSIVVPVRNEIRILKESSKSLLALNYKDLQIIYYDDASSDGSSQYLSTLSKENKDKVRYIKRNSPQKGWLGKNYACYTAASKAKGEYLLFIDADVIISNQDLLSEVISFMKANNLEGLSLMPEQRSNGFITKYLVPFIMQWPILNFMPMKLAELIKVSFFANGQFLLVTNQAYKAISGHESVKHSLIEDISLFKRLTSKGYSVQTLFNSDDIHTYMYEDLSSSINGFAKNLYYVFGGNLFSFSIWQILLFSNLIPFFYLFITKDALPLVILILFSRLLMIIRNRGSILIELLMFPVQLILFIAISWISIYRNLTKKVVWKDRDIYSSSSTSIA